MPRKTSEGGEEDDYTFFPADISSKKNPIEGEEAEAVVSATSAYCAEEDAYEDGGRGGFSGGGEREGEGGCCEGMMACSVM